MALQSNNMRDSGVYKVDLRSIEVFHILLNNPHKAWHPGEEVAGTIIFISKRNLANVSIILTLVGYVKVKSSMQAKVNPTKHILFNHTTRIYGEEVSRSRLSEFENGLLKGEHRFPFVVKLPKKNVHSSISFGKGSIKYLLRASVGDSSSLQNMITPIKPGNLADTSTKIPSKAKAVKNEDVVLSSEKQIHLVNSIDVSKLPPATAKKLVIRDPRLKGKLSRTYSSASTVNTVNTFRSFSSNNSDTPSPHDGTTTQPQMAGGTNSTSTPDPRGAGETNKQNDIKVSLEIPQRGYLRGELIPISVNISHLRQIQDMNGIIITLVRVSRLDNGPEGLYESFRKDLQQLVLPLFVDPKTLKGQIRSSIRVPVDAFPTIVGCPLMSFQYYIEVLLNLSGKSVSLDDPEVPKQKEHTSLQSYIQTQAKDFKFDFSNYPNILLNHNERSFFVNTDKFKKMKKFVQLTSEITIGTTRLVPKEENTLSFDNGTRLTQSVASTPLTTNNSVHFAETETLQSSRRRSSLGEELQENVDSTPPYTEAYNDAAVNSSTIPTYNEIQSPNLIPLPETSQISEKERMRIHEASLYPSEPPLDVANINNEDMRSVSTPGIEEVYEEKEEFSSPLSPVRTPQSLSSALNFFEDNLLIKSVCRSLKREIQEDEGSEKFPSNSTVNSTIFPNPSCEAEIEDKGII